MGCVSLACASSRSVSLRRVLMVNKYVILFSFGRLLALALAIAIAAIWVSKSPMLEGARRSIDRKNRWVGYAMKCAFCVVGWSAFLFTLLYRPTLLRFLFSDEWYFYGVDWFVLPNFIVSWFSLWGLATLWYRHLWPFLEKNAPKMRVPWGAIIMRK